MTTFFAPPASIAITVPQPRWRRFTSAEFELTVQGENRSLKLHENRSLSVHENRTLIVPFEEREIIVSQEIRSLP